MAPSASSPQSSKDLGRSAEAITGASTGPRSFARATTCSPAKSTSPVSKSERITVRYSRSCSSGLRQVTPYVDSIAG